MQVTVKKAVPFILICLYVLLGLHFKPWEVLFSNPSAEDIVLGATLGFTLIGLIVSCGRMIMGSDGARSVFLFFNAVFLIFGCYMCYIYWTLWIFQTPTLLDRIRVTIPPFVIGVIMPILLFRYFRSINKNIKK